MKNLLQFTAKHISFIFIIIFLIPSHLEAKKNPIGRILRGAGNIGNSIGVAGTLFSHPNLAKEAIYICQENSAIKYFRKIDNKPVELDQTSFLANKNRLPSDAEIFVDIDAISTFDLATLSGNELIYLLDKEKNVAWPVVNYLDDGVSRSLIYFSDRLIVNAKNIALIKSIRAIDSWKFSKQDIHLTSLFDKQADYRTYHALEELSKAENVSFDHLSQHNIDAVLKKNKNKIMMLVSHIEDGKVYAMDQFKNPIKDKFFYYDDLQARANEQNVYLLMLGCNSYNLTGATGFGSIVNSIKVTEQVRSAINQKTFFNFYNNLGTKDAPLYVDNLLIEHGRLLLEGRIIDSEIKEAVAINTLVLSSSKQPYKSVSNQEPSKDDTETDWPWWAYLIGIIIGINVIRFIFK